MLRPSVESLQDPTRLQIGLWAVTMLLTLYLLLYDWSGYQVGRYGDDGSYVAVTDSLLFDGNYGMLLDPGETEPTQFPFIYPLMLAPLRAWFPENLDLLRIVSVVATLGLLGVLFWGWRWIGMGLSYWWGVALTAVFALSPVTILHGRTVMSEAVFTLFVLLLVLWVEYVVVNKPRAWGILFGIIAVGTVYSRTVGWAFLLPAVGYLIWKMRGSLWQQLGVTAATMAVFVGLIVATTTVQPEDLLPQEYMGQLSYVFDNRMHLGPFADEISATADNTTPAPPEATTLDAARRFVDGAINHLDIADMLPFQMERAVIDTTDRLGMPFLRYLPLLGALAAAGFGVFIWLRRTGVTCFLLVAPVYLLMLMIWAWNGSRLIYPVQPQIFLALMLGVYGMAAWIVARWLGNKRRILAGVLTTLLVLWLGAWVWLDLQLTRTMLLPGDQLVRAAVLQKFIPPDAIVVSTRAETDFLYSPQRFIEVPRERLDTPAVRNYLLAHHVDYVISPAGVDATQEVKNLRIGKMTRFLASSEPLIRANALIELYRNEPDDLAIYRVDKAVLGTLPGD